MRNSKLYLKCVELAMRPVKGMNYNYDSLMDIAENIVVDDGATREEKIKIVLGMFDKSANGFYSFPTGPDGRPIQMKPEDLSFPIEKTLSIDQVLVVADKIYQACISRAENEWEELMSKRRDAVSKLKVGEKFISAEFKDEIATIIQLGLTQVKCKVEKINSEEDAGGFMFVHSPRVLAAEHLLTPSQWLPYNEANSEPADERSVAPEAK